jgi:deoxyadenosine/deoxycytidine kinase
MIQSDNLDFVHRADHLDVVVRRIEDRLSGKEQLVFPR